MKNMLPDSTKISLLSTILLACFFARPAQATNPPGRPYVTTYTAGQVEVKGWEQGILKQNPNLRHWHWDPVYANIHKYKVVHPGGPPRVKLTSGRNRDPLSAGRPTVPPPRVSRYIKPIHVPYQLNQKAPPTFIGTHRPPPTFVGGHRTPNTIDGTDVNANLMQQKVEAQLAQQRLEAQLAQQRVAAQLAQRRTDAQLMQKKTDARLAHEKVGAQLADRKVSAQLADRQVGASLANRDVQGKIATYGSYKRSPENTGEFIDENASSNYVGVSNGNVYGKIRAAKKHPQPRRY